MSFCVTDTLSQSVLGANLSQLTMKNSMAHGLQVVQQMCENFLQRSFYSCSFCAQLYT